MDGSLLSDVETDEELNVVQVGSEYGLSNALLYQQDAFSDDQSLGYLQSLSSSRLSGEIENLQRSLEKCSIVSVECDQSSVDENPSGAQSFSDGGELEGSEFLEALYLTQGVSSSSTLCQGERSASQSTLCEKSSIVSQSTVYKEASSTGSSTEASRRTGEECDVAIGRLRKELARECSVRAETEQLNKELQVEYEKVLKRLAECESHIDRLRLSSSDDHIVTKRISFEYEFPPNTPLNSIPEVFSPADVTTTSHGHDPPLGQGGDALVPGDTRDREFVITPGFMDDSSCNLSSDNDYSPSLNRRSTGEREALESECNSSKQSVTGMDSPSVVLKRERWAPNPQTHKNDFIGTEKGMSVRQRQVKQMNSGKDQDLPKQTRTPHDMSTLHNHKMEDVSEKSDGKNDDVSKWIKSSSPYMFSQSCTDPLSIEAEDGNLPELLSQTSKTCSENTPSQSSQLSVRNTGQKSSYRSDTFEEIRHTSPVARNLVTVVAPTEQTHKEGDSPSFPAQTSGRGNPAFTGPASITQDGDVLPVQPTTGGEKPAVRSRPSMSVCRIPRPTGLRPPQVRYQHHPIQPLPALVDDNDTVSLVSDTASTLSSPPSAPLPKSLKPSRIPVRVHRFPVLQQGVTTTSSFGSPLERDSGFVGSDGSLKGHLKDEQMKENRVGSDGWGSVSFKSENERFLSSSLQEPDDTITESCNGERPASRSSGSMVYREAISTLQHQLALAQEELKSLQSVRNQPNPVNNNRMVVATPTHSADVTTMDNPSLSSSSNSVSPVITGGVSRAHTVDRASSNPLPVTSCGSHSSTVANAKTQQSTTSNSQTSIASSKHSLELPPKHPSEQTPEHTPKQTLEQTSEHTPEHTPKQTLEQTSKQMLEQTSEQTSKQMLEHTSEQTSKQTSEQTSEHTSKQTLEQTSEQTSEHPLQQTSSRTVPVNRHKNHHSTKEIRRKRSITDKPKEEDQKKTLFNSHSLEDGQRSSPPEVESDTKCHSLEVTDMPHQSESVELPKTLDKGCGSISVLSVSSESRSGSGVSTPVNSRRESGLLSDCDQILRDHRHPRDALTPHPQLEDPYLTQTQNRKHGHSNAHASTPELTRTLSLQRDLTRVPVMTSSVQCELDREPIETGFVQRRPVKADASTTPRSPQVNTPPGRRDASCDTVHLTSGPLDKSGGLLELNLRDASVNTCRDQDTTTSPHRKDLPMPPAGGRLTRNVSTQCDMVEPMSPTHSLTNSESFRVSVGIHGVQREDANGSSCDRSCYSREQGVTANQRMELGGSREHKFTECPSTDTQSADLSSNFQPFTVLPKSTSTPQKVKHGRKKTATQHAGQKDCSTQYITPDTSESDSQQRGNTTGCTPSDVSCSEDTVSQEPSMDHRDSLLSSGCGSKRRNHRQGCGEHQSSCHHDHEPGHHYYQPSGSSKTSHQHGRHTDSHRKSHQHGRHTDSHSTSHQHGRHTDSHRKSHQHGRHTDSHRKSHQHGRHTDTHRKSHQHGRQTDSHSTSHQHGRHTDNHETSNQYRCRSPQYEYHHHDESGGAYYHHGSYLSPTHRYGQPSEDYSPPRKHNRQPSESYDLPSHKYRQPSESYDLPSHKYRQPSKSYDPPSHKYRQPSESYDPPSHKYRQPSESYDPPSHKYRQPSESYDPPSHKYRQPSDTYVPPSHHLPHQSCSSPLHSYPHTTRDRKQKPFLSHNSEYPVHLLRQQHRDHHHRRHWAHNYDESDHNRTTNPLTSTKLDSIAMVTGETSPNVNIYARQVYLSPSRLHSRTKSLEVDRSQPAVSSTEEAQLEKACNLAKKLKRRSKRMELFLTMDLSQTLQ